jgi:hypothetical protein
MSCEHLVCAQCSGPVAEGRCSVCRAGRERVHQPYGSLSPALLATLTLLLIALVLVVHRFSG